MASIQELLSDLVSKTYTFAQPLFWVFLFSAFSILALRDPTLKHKLGLEKHRSILETLRSYLILLLFTDMVLVTLWYVNRFVIHLTSVNFPFVLITLVATLLFNSKIGFLTSLLITPAEIYYLNLNIPGALYSSVLAVIGQVSGLGIGVFLRSYMGLLGSRIDEVKELYWKTRKNLTQKTVEEGVLQALNKSTLTLSVEGNLEKVVKVITEQARYLLSAHYSFIILDLNGNMILEFSGERKLKPPKGLTVSTTKLTHFYKRTTEQGRTFTVISSKDFDLQGLLNGLEHGYDKFVVAPIKVNQELLGALYVLNDIDKPDFSELDIKKLKLFTPHASLALSQAKNQEELRALLNLREHFTSVASHELKTPLSTIKLYVQLLMDRSQDRRANVGFEKQLHTIHEEVNKLSSIINNLLDFSRIQSGKLELDKTTFDLEGLARERLEVLQRLYPDQEFKLVSTLEESNIYADKLRIDQVVTNLLTNAAKYSPSNTLIELSLSEEGSHFLVEVKDKGIGMEKAKFEKIFQPYYQADPTRTDDGKTAGLGLGLYISKEIVERHDGRISMDSHKGKGTRVFVHLPKSSPERSNILKKSNKKNIIKVG